MSGHWPENALYVEAIQNSSNLGDSELASGTYEQKPNGMPRPYSGGFTTTFHVTAGTKQYAIRCFTRGNDELEQRYRAITDWLRYVPSKAFCDAAYLPKGIRADGRWWPVIKMDWVAGRQINAEIQARLGDSSALSELAEKFRALVRELGVVGVAHGDLQHGNIMVDNGQLRLIDYDGIFLPALSHLKASETGHKNYQHPGRDAAPFDGRLDRFSSLLIYTALTAVAAQPALWGRYNTDENLLFEQKDIAEPARSRLFAELRAMSLVAAYAERLEGAARLPYDQVPNLEQFIAGDFVVPPRAALVQAPPPAAPRPSSGGSGGRASATRPRIATPPPLPSSVARHRVPTPPPLPPRASPRPTSSQVNRTAPVPAMATSSIPPKSRGPRRLTTAAVVVAGIAALAWGASTKPGSPGRPVSSAHRTEASAPHRSGAAQRIAPPQQKVARTISRPGEPASDNDSPRPSPSPEGPTVAKQAVVAAQHVAATPPVADRQGRRSPQQGQPSNNGGVAVDRDAAAAAALAAQANGRGASTPAPSQEDEAQAAALAQTAVSRGAVHCASPSVDAHVVSPAEPVYPANEQSADAKTVAVRLELDERGAVVKSTVARSSGSSDFDDAALQAARGSTFAPAVVGCVPQRGTFLYTVSFPPR